MRKTRLIFIVAIIALLVVGAAYASWNSRVTISANASSGEMDVEISSIAVGQVSDYVAFGADSISISEDKKSATVSINNLYPGAEANATIVVTNIGTIPVMLTSASQVRELAVNMETNEDLSSYAANMLVVQYTARAETKNGQVKLSDSSSETTASLFQNAGIVIEAGETITFDMQLMMDKDAPDETENALFRFQFIPMFVQSNGEATGGGSGNEDPINTVPTATETDAEEPSSEETPEPENAQADFTENFTETASLLIEKIEEHYEETGKYGRTWDTYAYTDIGLTASDWVDPIDHVTYSPSGSKLYIRPEVGYTFTVESASGATMKLPESYHWNLVYSCLTEKWYFHTIDDSNEIDISTLSIAHD